jgi:hypothetical protein
MKKIFLILMIGTIGCGPSTPVKDILSIETVTMIGSNSAYIALPSCMEDGYNDMSSARPAVVNATIKAFEVKYKVKVNDYSTKETGQGGVVEGIWVKF